MVQLIVIALGAIFAAAGIVLFAKGVGKDSPTTIKFPGTEFSFSGSALLVFILGCALIYLATKMPDNPAARGGDNATNLNGPKRVANNPPTPTPAADNANTGEGAAADTDANAPGRRPLPPANGQPLGVDISHFQQVDWERLDKKYVSFVIIKATEGTARSDPQFDMNWAGAGRAGVKRGAYHVFHLDEDGRAQAQWFLAHVQFKADDLPPILDVEVGLRDTQMRADALSRQVKAWPDYVEQQTRRTPIIYTAKAFWDAHVAGDFGRYPLWVAQYGARAPANLPKGWQTWVFWHYTDQVKVGGIQGPVDTHMFNGSYQELLALK